MTIADQLTPQTPDSTRTSTNIGTPSTTTTTTTTILKSRLILASGTKFPFRTIVKMKLRRQTSTM